MARAQISFVQIFDGVRIMGGPNAIIRSVTSTLAPIDVDGTATAGEARPVVPVPADTMSQLYARVTALDGALMAAWGADPTASDTSGLLIVSDATELIPVEAGDKLSFIEVA